MNSRLTLVGAPTSAGAYAPGQEKAPAAFRAHGIVQAMTRAGWEVRDAGDVEGFRWRPDPLRPKAMNLDAVVRIAQRVAERVADAQASGDVALVLGGDCTVEVGSVAGILKTCRSVGLIYIDLDTDLNPPAASDGALDWTGVAHLLDLEGAAPELSALGPRRPMLSARDLLLFGADPITQTEVEKATVDSRQLRLIELEDVRRNPAAAIRWAIEWGQSFERLAIHLDADILSFAAFPIAENVRRQAGLTLPELSIVLQGVFMAPNLAALTITEINPDHAPDPTETFRALISSLASAMARESRFNG